MGALFGTPRNFEERLQLAFRGSAKEQKESTKKFRRIRQLRFAVAQGRGPLGRKDLKLLADNPLPAKAKLGGSNVFKRNLGGTTR